MIKISKWILREGTYEVKIRQAEIKEDKYLTLNIENSEMKRANLNVELDNVELISKIIKILDDEKQNTVDRDINYIIKEKLLSGLVVIIELYKDENGIVVLKDIYKKTDNFKNKLDVVNGKKEDVIVDKEIKVGENFLLDKEGVYKIQKDGEKKRIADYMVIKELITNIDTNNYKILISYITPSSEIKEIVLNRDECINKNKLLDLINKGVDVTNSNSGMLAEYFRAFEKNFKEARNVHSELGFSKYQNKEIYKLYKVIGELDSTYNGDYDIKPKGNKEVYETMLREEVYGRCELEFIIVSSLSAVVLGYIGDRNSLDSLIIHLSGNSSTGKSTALKLAISLFGGTDSKKMGLYNTYNSTENASLSKVGGLKGVPFAIDEISLSHNKDFSKFIYALANGSEKDRLNKNSELKEKKVWLTTILSNGEKSILESSKRNAGLKVRVIEANNFSWSKDSENSENINKCISMNYGHIGIEFAKYIMDKPKSEVEKRFEEVKKEVFKLLNEKLVVDSMTKRRCSKYALIILTAYYYEELKNIKLNIDEIKDMLVKIESESIKSRNFSESAIDYIKQYVSKYKKKFEGNDNASIDTLGKLIIKNDHVEVQMNKISFEEMIKQGGFEDKTVVLKELRDKGFLNHEKDRLTRSRKNTLGYTEDVYVVKLPKEKETFEDVEV
ncbi:DUF927 domain-containing protein [Clostridium perfringens]|uniref:DUF927 domain-containing protein n=1 Tax=Clostridium perfringens TaxID=1502 RepID=UPI0018E45790|nr:DUF927 domain-containing protein [Clostridium perfringens]MBI6103259.1 DUF927 domain-containing protein [Clostridium perfringens]